MSQLRQVRKRDGRLVPFQREKVAEAIFRAAQSVGGQDRFLAEQLAGVVSSQLERQVVDRPGAIPSIEDVQDTVERILIEAGHARTAKSYILYRERRTQARARRDEARRATGGGSHVLVEGADALSESRADGESTMIRQAAEAESASLGGDEGSLVFAPVDPADPGARRWSKHRIAEALMQHEGVPRHEAESIARAVEE